MNCKLKKTTIAAAVAAVMAAPVTVTADVIDVNFNGLLTLVGATGVINPNVDASGDFDPFGFRTPISGSFTYDTNAGMSVGLSPYTSFSFFGSGLISTTSVSFLAIGDGFGGNGTLMGASMGFNWGFGFGLPVTAIFDAAGFFNSIQGPGSSWSVSSGCAGCAISATPDTLLGHSIGAIPMSMTSYDTAGTTLASLLPLSDDGIAGSPMTTAPFPGQNFTIDFTTINATNVTPVPVPAAAWLLGSGLLGLVGVARRRR